MALGSTDMRRGFGAAGVARGSFLRPPVLFRGKRGDLVKALWWDGQGMCLFSKRLEHGRFLSLWPLSTILDMSHQPPDWDVRVPYGHDPQR